MGYNTVPFNPFPPSTEQKGNGGTPYTLPIASDEVLGGVMIGEGLSINSETGELSNDNPTPYELPIASDETLGGVMVGNGLSIDVETGELTNDNPTPYAPPAYSTNEIDTGLKWIDGKTIYRKVINVGDIGASGTATYTHNISNFEHVVSFDCVGISNDGYSYCNDGVVLQYATDTIFGYRKTFDTSGYTSYFIVEYTKVTPTP